MQSAAAGVRRHRIGEARGLVDRQVVRRSEAVVERVGGPCGRRRHAPQASQIENLHAVVTGIVRDDVRVVPIDLDVAPGGIPGFRRQPSQENRVSRVGNVDEGRAVGHAHQGVFPAGLRVRPSPDVVAARTAHGVEGHPPFERDALARIVAGAAVHASRRAAVRGRGRLHNGRRYGWWRRGRNGRRRWRRVRVAPAATAAAQDRAQEEHRGGGACNSSPDPHDYPKVL